jgi:deoxyribonuclease-4
LKFEVKESDLGDFNSELQTSNSKLQTSNSKLQTSNSKPLLAGAHMSVAGGLHKAFERGRHVRCRTIQIFLKNSNQWKSRPITDEDRDLFLEAQSSSGISPVIAHDSYLANLASPDPILHQKSLEAFMEEMRRANLLGVPYLVFHPGAHMGAGTKAGTARAAHALNQALALVEPPVRLLAENTAGQGSCIGSGFEELAAILDRIRSSDRIGICFDTCHAFAAGYDIRTAEGYAQTIRDFGRLIGIGRIKAFHMNDSKKGLGSRVDRHFHIGKGLIGLEAFRCIINDRRFERIPKILETPKGKGFRQDMRNLRVLDSLAEDHAEPGA